MKTFKLQAYDHTIKIIKMKDMLENPYHLFCLNSQPIIYLSLDTFPEPNQMKQWVTGVAVSGWLALLAKSAESDSLSKSMNMASEICTRFFIFFPHQYRYLLFGGTKVVTLYMSK